MNELFLTILNMSLTGAYVIAAICALRLALKKAPKIISYCLWSVAGFRLLFPFSFESVVSLIPFNSQAIPHDIAMQAAPRIETGVRAVDNFVSASLPAATPNMSVNPLQIWTEIGAYIWFAGAAALMLYGVVSYFVLKHKMRVAKPAEGNIFEADNIRTPFVLGILSPKIYIPVTLQNHERDYIILHEQTHIRRGDHIIKFAAFFLLSLHWFNPLAWAAFMLMGADMEMSCDERVIKEMKGDNRCDYSRSLLSLATGRRFIGGSPLAFGEGGVKARIKNVLGFKKRSRFIVICAVALAMVFAVGFTVNKATATNEPLSEITVTAGGNQIECVPSGEGFESIMSGKVLASMPDIDIGSEIAVMFEKGLPDSATLTDRMLTHDGIQKFSDLMTKPVNVAMNDGRLSFTLDVHYAYALSSDSADYELGTSLRGFRLTCAWGNDVREYDFIIRTDPVAGEGIAYFNGEHSYGRSVVKIFDYFYRADMPWDKSVMYSFDIFPNTFFTWSHNELVMLDSGVEWVLYEGMPIWSLYLADLTGDGVPEFCSSVSMGSGMIDNHVMVYDYVSRKTYELSDRMQYDYRLYMDGAWLMVEQSVYNGEAVATGELKLVDGKLTFGGMKEAKPSAAEAKKPDKAEPGDVISVWFYGGGDKFVTEELQLTKLQKALVRDMLDEAGTLPMEIGHGKNAKPTTLIAYRAAENGDYVAVNLWTDGSFAVSDDAVGVSTEALEYLTNIVAEQIQTTVDVFDVNEVKNIVSYHLRFDHISPYGEEIDMSKSKLVTDGPSRSYISTQIKRQKPLKGVQTCPYVLSIQVTRADGKSFVFLINDHEYPIFVAYHLGECPDYQKKIENLPIPSSPVPLW